MPETADAAGGVDGGYLVPWAWTGFTGNTLWDWLQMLLVPFAIPAAVVILTNRQSAS